MRVKDINRIIEVTWTQSQYVCNNKLNSTMQTPSTTLSDWLTLCSTVTNQPASENKKPAINHSIKLHTALSDTGHQTLLEKNEEEDDTTFNRYPECIDNEDWDTFLVNPFDLETLQTFTRTNLQSQHRDNQTESMTPPYRISFKSITLDVLLIKGGEQQIDVCRMNAYQIIPGSCISFWQY
jgi:hypothetical protein